MTSQTHKVAISPEDIQAWKHNPVTQALMAALNRQVGELKDGLVDGAFMGDPVQQARTAGGIRVLVAVQDVTLEDLTDE